MFSIADGRESFYQWDLDRQIIVDDNTIAEVHFCNRTDDCSLVVEVVDGVANVPNILLQHSFDIRVFGYDGKATKYDAVFKVKPRTQPADYMYTETVVKSIDELLAIAEQTTTLANEVYEYVEEHRLDFTDDGEGNVKLEAIEREEGEIPGDLSNYYTKSQTDAKIAEAIEAIDIPETDLSEYAKKTDIPDTSNFISSIPEEYITETELSAKGYLTEHQSLDGKADKVHSHPEYLTEHQSLEGYAKLTDIPTVPSLDGYATEQYVTNAITTAFAGIATAEGGSY